MNHRYCFNRGFSLIELLVVITIIGIIAGIGVGYFAGLRDEAGAVTVRRNAQTIAQVAAAAQASGNVDIAAAANLDEALTLLFNGASKGAGVFSDMEFRVSELSESDKERAKVYLDFEDGTITYRTSASGSLVP